MLVDLLGEQRRAILARDPDALVNTLRGVAGASGRVAQCLDTPPCPRERALLAVMRRLNEGNRRLLELTVQPLHELADLARRHGVAAAIDQVA